jgi:hypothetical protein
MISLPPIVTLVDIDGFAVPVGEKDIPDVPPPDPADPADWPAWTDNWLWAPTDPEDGRSVQADAELVPPELDPEAEDTGEFPPPGIDPEPYDPTPEDEADYERWLADLEARRDREARGPDRYSPESLQAIHRALWGVPHA